MARSDEGRAPENKLENLERNMVLSVGQKNKATPFNTDWHEFAVRQPFLKVNDGFF